MPNAERQVYGIVLCGAVKYEIDCWVDGYRYPIYSVDGYVSYAERQVYGIVLCGAVQ